MRIILLFVLLLSPLSAHATLNAPQKNVKSSYDSLFQKYFGGVWTRAKKIGQCESGLRADAIGDRTLTYQKNGITYGYSVGIMQIRTFPNRPAKKWLLNPENNIFYASKMYKQQGFKPWTCHKKV